jgi:hypothetical protein
MAQRTPAIKALPPEIVAQIRSSTTITSLSGVVVELAKNSLDAGATKIDITTDFRLGACSVTDDGEGIPQREFREDGGLGKLHRTSVFSSCFLSALTAFIQIRPSWAATPQPSTGIKGHSFIPSLRSPS